MSERVHLLAQSILGKPTLEECTLQETRDLANRYPYFAPAQFLYLQKLKSSNHEDYLKQLQKAVLYYHNPLAFEYFISSDRFVTEINIEKNTPAETFGQTTSEALEHQDLQQEQKEKLTADDLTIEKPETTFEENSANINQAESSTGVTEETQPNEVDLARTQSETTKTDQSSENPGTENQKHETVLSFEPYHTVDYFASQGIKLSQEEVSRDKFGKQLKSFTDWLKTMKRLPSNQVAQVDTSSEKKVSHLAQDSVHNSDVITEAMAEVWLKQGNIEKAIETYNKLSLLNPSKKAYFATLIENLKRS